MYHKNIVRPGSRTGSFPNTSQRLSSVMVAAQPTSNTVNIN